MSEHDLPEADAQLCEQFAALPLEAGLDPSLVRGRARRSLRRRRAAAGAAAVVACIAVLVPAAHYWQGPSAVPAVPAATGSTSAGLRTPSPTPSPASPSAGTPATAPSGTARAPGVVAASQAAEWVRLATGRPALQAVRDSESTTRARTSLGADQAELLWQRHYPATARYDCTGALSGRCTRTAYGLLYLRILSDGRTALVSERLLPDRNRIAAAVEVAGGSDRPEDHLAQAALTALVDNPAGLYAQPWTATQPELMASASPSAGALLLPATDDVTAG